MVAATLEEKQLGQLLQAQAARDTGGGVGMTLERADRVFAAVGSDENRIGSDPAGGFLVPTEMLTPIDLMVKKTSRLYPRCTTFPMTTARLVLPILRDSAREDGQRWGGVQSYWAPETLGATPTRSTAFAQLQLEAKTLMVTMFVTHELVTDAQRLGQTFLYLMSQEMAWRVDEGILRGSVGGLSGILTSPGTISVAPDETQGTKTLTYANVVNMAARLWPYCDSTSACWLVSKSAEQALLNGDGSLTRAVRYAGPDAPPGTPRYSLLGAPVLPIEQASAVGTPGDIVLADLSQYVIGTRTQPNMIVSAHVRFVASESAFRVTWRLDGQSSWRVPVEPAYDNASQTQGPFVILGARS